MATKPSNIVFGVEDKPPLWMMFSLAFQHICIIAIVFSFPVLVVRHAGGTPEDASRMVAVSMVAVGIGTILQALKRGPVGSGYLCPHVCGPSFLSASILAAKTGGLSLVFGMTAMAGVVESLLSRILKRMRVFFPAEVTGLIVAMVGITVIKLAAQSYFGISEDSKVPQANVVAVASITLATMIGLNVWSRGNLKLLCVLIGMVVGYALSWSFGILGERDLSMILTSPWMSFPIAGHPGWSFDWGLVVPFLVAVLCSMLKTVGDLTTCQKINDANWKRSDMENVSQGVLADGLGALSAGLLGGFGSSTSSSNIGLSIATGVTSRVIAFAIGGLLLVVASCPKITALFAIMPSPVIGATLVFALSFMVVAGIQIIMSRMMDTRKTFVVGTSMVFGLSVDILPEAYSPLHTLHPWIEPIFSSSLSAATIMAVVLNLVFRIGIAQQAVLELAKHDSFSDKIFTFMDRQGGLWGMRKEVVRKAEAAMTEFMEAATALELDDSPIRMKASFDEFHLDIDIQYKGQHPMEMPARWPPPEDLLEKEGGAAWALLLMKEHADRVNMQHSGETAHVLLHFEH